MDSGREALLEKAREFGSLAHNLSWNEILSRSVTYRTLALYLGIQKEWWEEFERSFSFSEEREGIRSFQFGCKSKDFPFLMNFLSNWFGGSTRIADVAPEEFEHAYHLVLRS